MPQRDAHHDIVKRALIKAGWHITAEQYVLSYDNIYAFVDLAGVHRTAPTSSALMGFHRENDKIAGEVKEFRGSIVRNFQQAIGQYILYRLLLSNFELDRELYLAITTTVYDNIFDRPIGQLVLRGVPINLIVVDAMTEEIQQWIKPTPTASP